MNTIKKFMASEAFKYLVFGVLTTLVYYIFLNIVMFATSGSSYSAPLAEAVGQIVSIIFAFWTNKKWVFEHESDHVFLDFLNFSAGRIAFMVLAVILKWWFGTVHPEILTGLIHQNFKLTMNIFSLFLQVLNILLNYFYSKFLVFRKKSA
ncbi:GtrA family protein [Lactococcus termiticola]|uniref:Cell wall teichoic acid glycosylation protein n=1 Tax=Lactococcus termiticola TaxID=2169526 RepID=A0A2R5HHW0_9LACT|nr:GtrA family protein [Lactococcus termiticola]GBG96975.1 cell wall teichoic acid glycosylation protein [Lactococcus termiticola]